MTKPLVFHKMCEDMFRSVVFWTSTWRYDFRDFKKNWGISEDMARNDLVYKLHCYIFRLALLLDDTIANLVKVEPSRGETKKHQHPNWILDHSLWLRTSKTLDMRPCQQQIWCEKKPADPESQIQDFRKTTAIKQKTWVERHLAWLFTTWRFPTSIINVEISCDLAKVKFMVPGRK